MAAWLSDVRLAAASGALGRTAAPGSRSFRAGLRLLGFRKAVFRETE
jgi:hypothetical protein